MSLFVINPYLNFLPFIIFSGPYIYKSVKNLSFPIIPYVFLLLCIIDGRSIIPFSVYSISEYEYVSRNITKKIVWVMVIVLLFLYFFNTENLVEQAISKSA